MRINLAQLKMRAKAAIFNKKNRAVLVSSVMFILLLALNYLESHLSGYYEWFTSYYNMMYNYSMRGGELSRIPWPEVTAFSIVLCILINTMQAVLRAGYVSWCMTAARGKNPVVKDIFNGFTSFGRVIILTILRGILIYVGLALLIVPGLLFLYRYRLSFFILFDRPELSAVACMRESARLTRGHRTEMLMLDLSFFGWWLMGIFISTFTIPMMDLWLRPYYGLTYAYYYDLVLDQQQQSEIQL